MRTHPTPRILRRWTPLALFLLALAVRALPWPNVYVQGRVDFFGADAYYHMRRIAWGLARFPETLSFDAYLNFPDGGKPIWPALHDALLVLALWPVHGLGGLELVERVVVWVPPLLGAATVLALYALAMRHFGYAVATCSALLLSVLSAHFWYSQIGFVDHHAAVSLLSTLLLMAGLELLRDGDDAPRAVALACGGLAGILLLVWPGALLYVAIVMTVLGFDALLAGEQGEARRRALRFALANGVALLLVLPAGLASWWPQWGEFSPVVISRFQPWLFASLALWGALSAGLWRGRAFAVGRPRRVSAGAALAVAILLLGILAFPGLLEGVRDARGWLFKRELFQAAVRESRPLFVGPDGPGVAVAEQRLSRFVYLVPLALLALGRELLRERRYRVAALLVAWCLVLALVTLLQKRFFNTSSVALALLMGWSLVRLHAYGCVRFGGSAGRRVAVTTAVGALALLLLAPLTGAYREPLRNQIRWLRGDALRVARPLAARRQLVDAAQWLRRETPPTAGFLDPTVEPEYGVLSDWGNGHVLLYRARRPTVVGNFGDDLGPENFTRYIDYFRTPEAQATQILDALRVRYVVARPIADLEGTRGPGAASMIARFSAADPAGLSLHRLVYESGPAPAAPGGPPDLKIFEYVRGAEVVGGAPPGQRVTARVSILTNQGREATARTSAIADAGGRYVLRVPYANRGSPPAVSVALRTSITAGDRRDFVQIEEEQVRLGLRVAGPSF